MPLDVCEHLLSVRPSADRDMFQTFGEGPSASGQPQVLNAPRWRVGGHLGVLNRRQHAIFYGPSGFGTSTRRWIIDVTHVGHLRIDKDDGPLPPHMALQPHAIVNTSGVRHQAIWRVDGLPQDNTTHRRILIALARIFGGDEKATGINRVLRLAGFYHLKREPSHVRLVYASEARAWTLEEVLEAWPELRAALQEPEPPKPATVNVNTNGLRLGRYVAQAIQGEYDNVAAALEGSRNNTLHRAAIKLASLVGAGALSEADARDALLAGVAAMRDPISASAANATITSGLRYGKVNPRQFEDAA